MRVLMVALLFTVLAAPSKPCPEIPPPPPYAARWVRGHWSALSVRKAVPPARIVAVRHDTTIVYRDRPPLRIPVLQRRATAWYVPVGVGLAAVGLGIALSHHDRVCPTCTPPAPAKKDCR